MRRCGDVQESDEDENGLGPIDSHMDGLAETSGAERGGTNGQYAWRISNHHIISTLMQHTCTVNHTRCGLPHFVRSLFTIAIHS
jgi:hypothetical protein